MVNYKIVNASEGSGEMAADIVETKTDQIIIKRVCMSKAKEMVRHLNFGGGFDGSTPAFFLAESAKMLDSNQ